MAPKRKQQSRQFEQMADSISNRVGMRNRIPKQFSDYVDCSFSESEPVRLVPIPLRKDATKSSHVTRGGRGGRGTNKASVAKRSRYQTTPDSSIVENEDPSTCGEKKIKNFVCRSYLLHINSYYL